MIDRFGERHLVVGQVEAVPGRGHRVGCGFQVPTDDIEIALCDRRLQVVVGA
jgi:hypothetical protein